MRKSSDGFAERFADRGLAGFRRRPKIDERGYDPSQPRDDAGRWSGGGDSMAPDRGDGSGAQGTSPSDAPVDSRGEPVSEETAASTVIMYHGTLEANVASIMKEGIVPTSPKRFAESSQGERATKVFVTGKKAAADWYAKTAALYGPDGSTHAVFEVHVPADAMAAAQQDTSSVDSWMLDEIPPEWIKEVHKDGGTMVVYCPLAFAGDATPPAKEFLPLTKSPTTKIARAMVKAAHQQQVERVQRQASRKFTKYFQKSVKAITTRLFADTWEPNPEKAKSQAARLIKGAYDKDAQGDLLVDSASQPVADAFVEGAAAEMRLNAAARRSKAFDPSQPRDESGRWAGSEGGSTSLQLHEDSAVEKTEAATIHKLLGTAGDAEALQKLSRIAGGGDGAKVFASYENGMIKVDIIHSDYRSVRTIDPVDKVINNEGMEVSESKRGSGIGASIFHSQVQAASADGYKAIYTTASGRSGQKANGYYTWARLGYDADIDGPGSFLSGTVKEYAKENGFRRVSDFMRTPEHREWWKENASTFGGKFDLSEGSQSRKVLDAYVQAKRGSGKSARDDAGGRGDPGSNLGRAGQVTAFDPDQPRNPDGTWGSGGGSSEGGSEDESGNLPKTDTPEFKAWFGNSKVVDADGKPLVVYRGTAAHGDTAQGTDFTDDPVAADEYAELAAIRQLVDENEELASIIGEISTEEGAEDLTDLGGADRIRDIADANGIELPEAESKGHVEPAYVKIENPLDMRDYGSSIGSVDELWDDMHARGLLDEAWGDLDEEAQYEVQEQYRDKALYKFLDSEGIAEKAKAKGYDGIAFTDQSLDGKRTHDTWRVHGANQIKSANNRGTFDPNDPDITKGIKVTTATQAAERAEEEIDFPTEMPEWLEEAALDFISRTFEEDYWLRIPETTRDDIEYTLEQGIEDGLSIREIAARIQEDHGGAYSKSRATMVARTEMTGAMNAGHTEGIRQAYEGTGVEPAKEWLSVMGTTTRDTHADADGQQRPVDEDFDIGGHAAAFPGDARLPAGERCNCQCTVLSAFVGEGLSDDEYDGRSLDTEEEKRLGREMFEKYDPHQPRNPDGTWGTGGMAPDRGDGSGAEGTSPSEEPKLLGEWKNAAHKTAAEIHGVTPPDSKVVTKKVYHITKRENAEKILEEGFKLSHVRPRWLNDYAVSLSVGQAKAERYFTATDQTFNEEKYAVLEVTIKGRYTDENLPVGSAYSPQDYTSKITKLGWDGQDLNGVYYVHNPKSITSIKHVKAKTAKKDLSDDEEGTRAFDPDQPRDEDGRFASGGGGGTATSDEPSQADISTPEFKAWFKDSKVVDASGDPKSTHEMGRVVKVYHGTGGDFTEFDEGKIGSNGLVVGKGFYFAEDKRIADFYARTRQDQSTEGRVVEAYLSIQNPYDFEGIAGKNEIAKIRELASSAPKFDGELFDLRVQRNSNADGMISKQKLWHAIDSSTDQNSTNDILREAGYDGIVHTSADEYGTPVHSALANVTLGPKSDYGTVWIAFKPTQIKSTENEGTFDPDDPDITKST